MRPPSIAVGLGNNDCKLGFDWSCGATKYSVSGLCTQGKGFMGVCSMNGMQGKMFVDPNPMVCSCNKDPKMSFAPLAKNCGFPTN